MVLEIFNIQQIIVSFSISRQFSSYLKIYRGIVLRKGDCFYMIVSWPWSQEKLIVNQVVIIKEN